MTARPTPQESALLAPGVALLHQDTGWVLQTADGDRHTVLLAGPDVDALLDALVAGTPPPTPTAAQALDALVAAGHAIAPGTEPAPGVQVVGTGDLATAVTAVLTATGVGPDPDGLTVHVLDEPPGDRTPQHGLTCWPEGHLLVLCPVAVSALDTAARHRAARRPQQVSPLGRAVVSGRTAPSSRALAFAAAVVAAEAVRRAERSRRPQPTGRDNHLATVLDLRTLQVTRHPVLPVPRPVP